MLWLVIGFPPGRTNNKRPAIAVNRPTLAVCEPEHTPALHSALKPPADHPRPLRVGWPPRPGPRLASVTGWGYCSDTQAKAALGPPSGPRTISGAATSPPHVPTSLRNPDLRYLGSVTSSLTRLRQSFRA